MADSDRALNELVERLKKAHQDRLVSVILYGSAANGEGKDRQSDLNVLCVLTVVDTRELGCAEPVFRWWRDQHNPAPLLLSREEVQRSTDCFPIEFSDIRERRKVLYGEDVIAGLTIDYAFYRAQVEHELRAKVLRLRQKAGGVLSDPDLLMRLMTDSISTFCVLLRHALLLGGEVTPKFGKRDVVSAAVARFGVDGRPLERIIDAREGKLKTRDAKPAELLTEYLTQLYAVMEAVDRMER